MKLQGIIILRSTDFKRYFDLEEFLVKKNEFLALMSQFGAKQFSNTDEEVNLCGIVRSWLKGDPIGAEIKSDRLLISGPDGNSPFTLGVLKDEIEKYRDKLGFKDLYGLTALYLLAGVNERGCSFRPDFATFLRFKNGNELKDDFISLHKDIVLKKAPPVSNGSFRLCTLANLTAGAPVRVDAGDEIVILKEGQCVTGIFTDEGCITLLNRECSGFPNIYAELIPDKHSKQPDLRIYRDGATEVIHGVSTVWIEADKYIAYVKTDGSAVYDLVRCYNLNNRISLYNKHNKNHKLLAIKKTDNGNYVLYTDSQIEY